jgi:hypothetical protein
VETGGDIWRQVEFVNRFNFYYMVILETPGDMWRLLETLGDTWRHTETLGDTWRIQENPGDYGRYGDAWRPVEVSYHQWLL